MGRELRNRSVRRILEAGEVSYLGEAEYIVDRAAHRATFVVTLGPLVFFSTRTGDAWVLDPRDSVARCLAKGGEALPPGITETSRTFSVEWTTDYRIDGKAFIFAERSGQVRAVMGYPVTEITRAIRHVRAAR